MLIVSVILLLIIAVLIGGIYKLVKRALKGPHAPHKLLGIVLLVLPHVLIFIIPLIIFFISVLIVGITGSVANQLYYLPDIMNTRVQTGVGNHIVNYSVFVGCLLLIPGTIAGVILLRHKQSNAPKPHRNK